MKIRKGKGLARMARCFVLVSFLVSAVGWSALSMATEGDVFAEGVQYNTLTYSGHPSKCGTPIDINIQGTTGNGDEGTPLYAPEDGKIQVLSYSAPNGWGNNIYWIGDNGEKLFLAHLKKINKTGSVDAGEKIGELGKTGSPWGEWSYAHLHIESCGEKLELSGKKIKANKVYTSDGPISGGGSGNLSIDQLLGSKEGKDDWERSFEISMDDIYDMDFRVKLVQEDGTWPSDTEASFYLSLDKDLDSGDIFLGSEERDLTKEKAQKRSIYLEDVDMSDYITSPGTYYVLTRVEFDGGEKESSPGDSKQRVKITVIDTSVPDLTVQSFQLNSGLTTITGDSPFGMKVAVRNIGDDDASNFRIKYEINGPGTGGSWRLLGEKNFTAGSIAAGATVWDSTDDNFALAPVVEGDYTLRGCVDSGGTVTESNEGNNCIALGIYIDPPLLPDLTPVYLHINGGATNLTGGSLYGLTFAMENIGEGSAKSNFQISYEIKGPETGDTWKLIGYSVFDSIPFDSGPFALKRTRTSDTFAAAPSVEGNYLLKACIDYKEVVPESNEENNCIELETYVSAAPPSSLKPVYRFWSDTYHSHFYTTADPAVIIGQYPPEIWRYEYIAWCAYTVQEDDSVPVHRFWSDTYNSHFYTTADPKVITDQYPPEIWRYDKIGWYAYDYEKPGTIPVHRFWSDTYHSHFYTTADPDVITGKYPPEIWRYEKIGWWVYPCP